MKINNIKTREGGKHYFSKQYLYDWILDKKELIFKLEDNLVFKLNLNHNYGLFSSLEAYIYNESKSNDAYCAGYCNECFPFMNNNTNNNYEEEWGLWDNQSDKFYNERFLNVQSEFNKNIIILNNDLELYQLHPCNFCKFKGRLNCILIFDIAFAKKGEYFLAIEVVDTSPTKHNKIDFCKKNDIILIEIQVKDILKQSHKENKILNCKLLNTKNFKHTLEYFRLK